MILLSDDISCLSVWVRTTVSVPQQVVCPEPGSQENLLRCQGDCGAVLNPAYINQTCTVQRRPGPGAPVQFDLLVSGFRDS